MKNKHDYGKNRYNKTQPDDSVIEDYFIIDKIFFTNTYTYNNSYDL